jgi:hypothetical protein
MIIDCHTHLWSNPNQLGDNADSYLQRQSGLANLQAGPAEHSEASQPADKTLVMAYRSAHLSANVPNELIGEYVSRYSKQMVGIAAVDPTEPQAISEASDLLDMPAFRGLTISPATQNFHPADSRAIKLYELAAERDIPLFIQHGTHFPTQGRMEYARPLLLDEIAREYPTLTMVISSLGHPWVEECIALIGKHPRVFGDMAGLIRRPWQAYNALILAHQFNVMDKVLFGSDFPFCTAAEAIKSVYSLHEVTQGTNLPSVPRETLRSMVERNSLRALGIDRPGEQMVTATTEVETDDEDEDEA